MIDKAKIYFGSKAMHNAANDSLPPVSLFQNRMNYGKPDKDLVEYLWSKEPAHLVQYAKMVDNNYDSELNLQDVYKKITLSDLRSYFRLGKIGNEVIAGVRMTVNDPYVEGSLPSEKGNFRFKDCFPDIDLKHNRYCEITRYTVKREHRDNMTHYTDAFQAFKEKQKELGVKYMLMWSSRGRQRIYKRFASDLFKLVALQKIDLSLWPEYSRINYKEDDVWVALYENESVK